MAVVRFVSPSDPELELPGVPATFVGGVWDVDSESNPEALTRMRWQGPPRGVIEVEGPVTNGLNPFAASIATDILANNSLIGQALNAMFERKVERGSATAGQAVVLRDDGALTFATISGGTGNPGGGTGGDTVVDNGDGTLTSSVVDNGDGTLTIPGVDNGDGTITV